MNFSEIDLGALWITVRDFVTPKILPTAGVLALMAVAYWIGVGILRAAEKRLASRTATQLDDDLIRMIRRALVISVWFGGLWGILRIWSLPDLIPDVIAAAWIVALSLPVAMFVGALLETLERRLVDRTETTLDDTALPLLNKVIRFIVVGLGLVIALDSLGVNIAPLLAGAGVMGLALSLAAKDTLSNLIAGVLLILDRPFRVGDRIELWNAPAETGTWGDVVEIGLRATKIRNPDNLVVVVPNNEIMQRDIVNYTMSGSHIRLRIPIGIAYDSDVETAKRLIMEEATQVAGVKKDPEPVVIVRSFGPSEVNLQLRVWIEDARRRRTIGDEITERVLASFDRHGVEIPYPKRDLYVRDMRTRGDGEDEVSSI